MRKKAEQPSEQPAIETAEQYFQQPEEELPRKSRLPRILFVILLLVILFILYNQWNLYQRISSVPKPDTTLLSEVDVTAIIPTNCKDCWNIDLAEQFFKKTASAKVITTTRINSSSPKAAELIKKYAITRLPALIITGEVDKLTVENFQLHDDALVFDQTPPPYTEVSTGKIKGKPSITLLLDSGCKKCFDIKLILNQLKQVGVVFSSEKTIEASSTAGKALINKYRIEKIPSLLLSFEALEYGIISGAWDVAGTKEKDGMLVLRAINPPYKNPESGKLQGLIDVTYVTDKSCKDCYDVTIHKNILASNFGMVFDTEKTIDLSSKEGKILVTKYDITHVPTVIVASEANVYTGFSDVWKQAGDTAKDGSFVFRNLDLLDGMKYKDLDTGEIITAGASSNQTSP